MIDPRVTAGRVAALCFGLGAATLVAAQTTQLSPDQMRAAAAETLRSGQPAVAQGYADALVARDATDLTAHLILSRALRDQGDYPAARSSARTAWSLAQTPAQKYSSALVMAQALASAGQRTRAQLWLRRAVQHAPNDALAARAKRDFRYVQQRNPWRTDLSFTLAPNSNINNGSARDTSFLNYRISEILFGQPVEYSLDGAAQALSGLEFGGGLRTRYRFDQSATHAQDLTFSADYRSFALSDGAKAQAPGVSGSDFAYGTVSVGYAFEARNLEGKGTFALGADLGQSWYGGARYASFHRLRAAQTFHRETGSQVRLSADHEWQTGQATNDVDTLRGTAAWIGRRPNGNQVLVSFGLGAASSPNADSEYTGATVQTALALARPVMGAAVQFGLGLEFRDYDTSRHDPSGREDAKIAADVTATFKSIDYYGFNPSVTLSASRTDSNIGLFDTTRFGVSLGIRSAF